MSSAQDLVRQLELLTVIPNQGCQKSCHAQLICHVLDIIACECNITGLEMASNLHGRYIGELVTVEEKAPGRRRVISGMRERVSIPMFRDQDFLHK